MLKNFSTKMNARAIALAKLMAIDAPAAKALIERRAEDLRATAKKAEGLRFDAEEVRDQEPLHKVILDESVKMGQAT